MKGKGKEKEERRKKKKRNKGKGNEKKRKGEGGGLEIKQGTWVAMAQTSQPDADHWQYSPSPLPAEHAHGTAGKPGSLRAPRRLRAAPSITAAAGRARAQQNRFTGSDTPRLAGAGLSTGCQPPALPSLMPLRLFTDRADMFTYLSSTMPSE